LNKHLGYLLPYNLGIVARKEISLSQQQQAKGKMDEDDMDIDNPEADDVWVHANAPDKLQGLRACIPCLLVKTYKQFMEEGCENCSRAFDMRDNPEKIAGCTTVQFEGLMAMTVPEKSWVARWQFVPQFIPGIYALKVKGEVSEETAHELQDAGLPNVGKMLQQDEIRQSDKKGT